MLFIHLHQLKFHAHHGVFEEEKLLGNQYEVDLSVAFAPPALPIRELDQTIDYTDLYSLVKRRMSQPTALLETIATELVEEIRSRYSEIEKISISVKKLYPPVNSFEGAVGVSFEWNK
jgi:7,8-dihydroneopterin aldolase/epimerase/oxygenase